MCYGRRGSLYYLSPQLFSDWRDSSNEGGTAQLYLQSRSYSHYIIVISFVMRVHLCDPICIRIASLQSHSYYECIFAIPFVLHICHPVRDFIFAIQSHYIFTKSRSYYIFTNPFVLHFCNPICITSLQSHSR